MALYTTCMHLQKPKDPKMILKKTVFILQTDSWAHASTSDELCANMFSLAATVKSFERV